MEPIKIDLSQVPVFRMLLSGSKAQDSEAFIQDQFAALYKGLGGLEKNSFTTSPAIGLKAVLQSGAVRPLKFVRNGDPQRRLITGVMLVPDQLLLKFDEQGQPHAEMYPREVIYHTRNKWMMGGNSSAIDWEHQGPNLSDVHLVETWIVENGENDKLNALGFAEQFRSLGFDGIPAGCLACTYFVPNEALWNEITTNPDGYGFSIKGYFAPALLTASATERGITKATELSKRHDLTIEEKCAALLDFLRG